MSKEKSVHRNIDDVVDGNDFEFRGALEDRLERLPADAAETIDSNADGHDDISNCS